jgi:hypothetical protein
MVKEVSSQRAGWFGGKVKEAMVKEVSSHRGKLLNLLIKA